MGHFKIKSKNKLEAMQIGDKISESDFATLTPEGTFVQLEYVENDDKIEPYKVKPGIWSIQKTMQGLKLQPTSYVTDAILESFIQTKEVTEKIDCFFNRLSVYSKRRIEIPIRRILLYGPAGTGKSTCISLAARKYGADGKTAVILWHTDKFEAFAVKDFIKQFDYEEVKQVILVAEDIGGVEAKEVSRHSDSSLLSLLDNQEKTFKIPTMIIATTNHPETFLGNLTNRPGRFSDKIEIGFPTSSARVELLKFFAQGDVISEELSKLVGSSTCAKFTADHLKELFLRSDLYDKSPVEVTKEMASEIESYENAFSKKSRMGFD